MARHSKMDCFGALAMTCFRILAARSVRAMQESPPKKTEGAGNAGRQCARSLACEINKAHERSHHESTGTTRHSRTRMVLTVFFVLSPAIGLSCHRRLRSCLRKHDAGVEASGPHDFAVRGSALSSEAPPASTASRPALMTLRTAPPSRQDGGSCRDDLPDGLSEIFLQMGLDRKTADLPDGQISTRRFRF